MKDDADILAELLVTGQILGMLSIRMGQPVRPIEDENGHYRNQLVFEHEIGDFLITVTKKEPDEGPLP